jgi:DnaJ-class molecular chaperone
MIECPECGGSGEVEVDYYAPQSASRDVGDVYSLIEECPLCDGSGEIEVE